MDTQVFVRKLVKIKTDAISGSFYLIPPNCILRNILSFFLLIFNYSLIIIIFILSLNFDKIIL